MRSLLIIALAFLIPATANATDSVFNNLSGFNSAGLKIVDQTDLLTSSEERRILLDFKLQLRSAGIKVDDSAKRALLIEIQHIPSAIAGHRISASLKMLEQTEIQNRDKKITVASITYFDSTLFKSPTSAATTEYIEDRLLSSFIEQYLNDN